MTEPASNEAARAGRAPSGSEPPALQDLRFIGEATEATLADADIDAAAILDRSVSFVQLVEIGVSPGVAARIRREYSLPWSDVPTGGARLRRRASHVRHLRPEERSWIEASRATDGSAASPAAAPDGSGSATDAERAWRDRSRPDAEPTRDDDGQPDAAVSDGARPLEVPPDMELPINPNDHTVPELREAIENIVEPVALAAVLQAERAGEARTTAVAAIEDRLEALGADPDAVEPRRQREQPDAPPRSVPSVQPGEDDEPVATADGGARTPPAYASVVAQLEAWRDAGRAEFQRAFEAAARAVHRQETQLDEFAAEDYHQLSMALLLGVVAFSAMTAFVVALQPAIGPPVDALPLFVVTLVVGVVSLPLRWWGTPGGVGLTLATGVVGLGTVGLVAAGTFGGVNALAGWLTLPAYALVALALLGTTYRSRNA